MLNGYILEVRGTDNGTVYVHAETAVRLLALTRAAKSAKFVTYAFPTDLLYGMGSPFGEAN